jgi:hypothetical protein
MLKGFPKSWIFVSVVSLLVAVGNSITFFYHLSNQPAGTSYLGTIHYWEDYFFYLNHFFQGAHGAWLTVNRYTSEPTNSGIIYWCNVMLGKIGGLFWLSPVLSYNLSVLLLSFTALSVSYLLINKILKNNRNLAIPAFLFATFATSLINRVKSSEGPMILWPFQIWRTPHLAFDRLGGAPHQLIQTILAYIFIYSIFSLNNIRTDRKYLIFSVLSGILLTTINPVQSLYYLGIVGLTKLIVYSLKFIQARKIIPDDLKSQILIFLSISIPVGVSAIYINNVLSLPPHVQSKLWEAGEHSYTTPGFLVLSIGPVFILAVLGIISKFRKITEIELFGLLTVISGYLIFFSRIPQTLGFSNLRILFPASYVFWGIFAAYGAQFIAEIIYHFLPFQKKVTLISVVAIFLLVSSPTIYWELKFKLPARDDSADPVIYLPETIYSGLEFLGKTGGFDSVVIASPLNHIDTMIPAFSGHTVYAGHMLTTIGNGEKQAIAARLFRMEITPGEAAEMLKSNSIRYVFFTLYDGDRNTFGGYYPFLSRIFANTGSAVFEVK